jgi:hypothetical protein
MSSYGAKGTRTPNNRLQRTVRYAARRTGAMELHHTSTPHTVEEVADYATIRFGVSA